MKPCLTIPGISWRVLAITQCWPDKEKAPQCRKVGQWMPGFCCLFGWVLPTGEGRKASGCPRCDGFGKMPLKICTQATAMASEKEEKSWAILRPFAAALGTFQGPCGDRRASQADSNPGCHRLASLLHCTGTQIDGAGDLSRLSQLFPNRSAGVPWSHARASQDETLAINHAHTWHRETHPRRRVTHCVHMSGQLCRSPATPSRTLDCTTWESLGHDRIDTRP